MPLRALRLPGFPLLIGVRLLTSRSSVEVCDTLERMVAFFESLQSEGFTVADSSRVKRLHSDRAGEFIAPYFERFLINHESIYHTFTSGHDPQSNGTAERAIGLVKSLAARLEPLLLLNLIVPTGLTLSDSQTRCSVFTASRTSTTSTVFAFGSPVVAKELDHKKIKFPDSRTVTGRLLMRSCSTRREKHWSPGLPRERSCTIASCNQH